MFVRLLAGRDALKRRDKSMTLDISSTIGINDLKVKVEKVK